MPKIVFQMVAFRLEGIVILVLNLSPSSPGFNNLDHDVIGNGVAGHKGVVVNHLT